MKKIYKTLGFLMIIIALTMMVFAWYFFFQEETAIIQLASLYLALSISVLIFVIGFIALRDRSE